MNGLILSGSTVFLSLKAIFMLIFSQLLSAAGSSKMMNIEQVQGLDGEVLDAAILIANVVLQQA